ncbi:hypothetical protein H9L12_05690 [Sphingomonas rhizophila]|uniref:Porin n=1 Tax=Sphingomonas rhizophila TaxID=2071607 RepID=A0A7G9SEC0_9SPHN|nr:hypothetical protein H9L12_05690 [Sphingomonas rhizophila]
MNYRYLAAASAFALASLSSPAVAQEHQHHPGMTMPMPEPKPAPKVEPSSTPPPAPDAAPPSATDHSAHGMEETAVPAMPAHGSMSPTHSMTGAYGSYPSARESSGTAWQPDTSDHSGLMTMAGDWSLMLHGELTLVHDWQEGPRGDSKNFAAGMLMGTARRSLGNGTLQFRAMVSPDPLMGKRGYPLLLASGETADGVTRIVDRQHPHDLFMELSASLSQPIGKDASAFIYAGLPGEPAFGPPAFMHRQSINVSPEAPISHHWLDSTHISFGVLTGGLIVGPAKVEVSRFNGREPDQRRFNIETGPLDSTAVRVSLNPTRTLSLQASWGHFVEPEQLEPGENQKRLSASGHWTVPLRQGSWATTIAWGRKSAHGHDADAVALESSLNWNRWTLFGRAERTENRELFADPEIETEAFKVGKASVGALYELPLASHLKLGLGGLYAFNFVPKALEGEYGGDPNGAMAFVRLKID